MAHDSKLATRLRMERARTNETQEQAAERIGIHQTQLCDYERGKRVPSLPTLIKIADAYGTSLDYLAGAE